jgi:hypothetical protein
MSAYAMQRFHMLFSCYPIKARLLEYAYNASVENGGLEKKLGESFS